MHATLYLKFRLPTPAAAAASAAVDSEPRHIFAAASYGDVAKYVLNYDSNHLLGENGDCVSVDANNQPAVWVLIKQQQAAAPPAAAAGAAGAVQGQASMYGAATLTAAAAAAGLQPTSTSTAGSSASAATSAAPGKPAGFKCQPWMEFARDAAARVLLCVRVPDEPNKPGIAFIKVSNKLKVSDADGERGTQHSYTIRNLYHCFRELQLAYDQHQQLTTAYRNRMASDQVQFAMMPAPCM